MRVFLARRKKPHRLDKFFAAFSTVMFFLITSWVVTDIIIVGERLWLLDRNYPGGPLAYLVSPAFVPFNRYQTAATIILQQMTDDLMVSPSDSGFMSPTDANLTGSVPGMALSSCLGQLLCYHYTLLPVLVNFR